MNSKKIILPFFAFFFLCSHLPAETNFHAVPLTKNPVTWPRTDVKTFGCFLEKELSYRHPIFNCDLRKYHNKGDQGPSFPDSKLQQIHPAIRGIELSWEHGDLQAVVLTFKPGFTPSQIQEFFHLPQKSDYGLPNLMSYDIQGSDSGSYSLILQGFDHQGTGD